MLRISISTEGMAFCDPKTGEPDEFYEGQELKRILLYLISDIEHGKHSGNFYDINGNRVGEWVR